ncbi:hypothetical protein ACIQ9P_00165 [Kitasatospora sp. NPDC094019]|uniref:hypothetical protein n=1 Tax=Kitasatospora sp. NPDC094019 TaxID=3364091 RepID=UPI00380BF855
MRNTRRTSSSTTGTGTGTISSARPRGPARPGRGSGRLAVLAAAGLAAAALVAGCGSSTSSSGGSPPANPPASSSAPAVPGASATLRTTTDPRLGTIVTDSAGFTLYRFDKDSATPSTATCAGDCAALWPPATADGAAPTVNGVDAKLVGTVTRADGGKQLTLAGWPLYRYAPDTNPGDTKGQGVQGVWFAVTPAGDRAAATSGGSGY